MKRRNPVSALILALVLCLSFTACSDDSLGKVAKSMKVYATTIKEVQKNVIAAQKVNLISEDSARQALDICERANVAGQQVQSVLSAIQTLDPASRGQILALLTPISDALDPTKIEFVTGIKDPATKQKIEGGFVLARSTISSIMIIASASGS
jgi:hypothetical protein